MLVEPGRRPNPGVQAASWTVERGGDWGNKEATALESLLGPILLSFWNEQVHHCDPLSTSMSLRAGNQIYRKSNYVLMLATS